MDGHVKGNVTGRAGEQTLLVVSDQGSITGNVIAYDIVINGTITGDVTVEHFVELQSNAHVNGNIYYQQLRMDVGASVEGKLTKRDNSLAPQVETPRLSSELTSDYSHSET
jgi:cytoskeletal protein CcmA (bactofilin family)